MCRLCVLVLISVLLVAPVKALPAKSETPGSWFQVSLDTVLDWILYSLRDGGRSSIGGDDGDALSLAAEDPQTLSGEDPVPDSPEGNSYPGLDPNG